MRTLTTDGRWGAFVSKGIIGARALGWQIDYRWETWLPLSVRLERRSWHILPLGPLGNVTLGRLA